MRQQLVSDDRLPVAFDIRTMIDPTIRAKTVSRLAEQTDAK